MPVYRTKRGWKVRNVKGGPWPTKQKALDVLQAVKTRQAAAVKKPRRRKGN